MDNNIEREIALNIMQQQEANDKAAMLREQADLEANRRLIASSVITPTVTPGYTEIFWETLPSKGLFQPKGARLFICSAKSEQVLAWSTINENDPASVNESINNILKACIEYIPTSGRTGSWLDLRECDKISLLFMIRDLTFPEPENKLTVNAECSEDSKNCGTIKIDVKSENFELVEIEQKYYKFYDENLRSFVFKLIDGTDFVATLPSIGIIKKITSYVTEKKQKKQTINESLINVLPFMFPDHRDFDNGKALSLEADMLRWDLKKISIVDGLIKILRHGATTNIKSKCAKCGKEVVAPMSFPGGFRTLFLLSNIDTYLLF
jgi:hypothetical protein